MKNDYAGKLPLPPEHGGELTEELPNADPLAAIPNDLEAIPLEYREEAFADLAAAVQSHDWRRLLQTIGNWTATGELYTRGLVEEALEAYQDYQVPYRAAPARQRV